MPRRTDRRGEAGEIADHAAAQRHDEVAALDARGDHRVADPLENGKALVPSPGGTITRADADAGGR